jgi:hypothetical protein
MGGKDCAKLVGLVARVGSQITLIEILIPDFLVGLADAPGAGVEDNAEKDRIPEKARPFDHPPVGEEFLQIAAHGGEVGAVGCAEVDDEHANLLDFYRRVFRRQFANGPAGLFGHNRMSVQGRVQFSGFSAVHNRWDGT